jgi:ATP-binding cassette subfamily B protein
MLPLMQQIYASWAAIRGGQSSVKDALDLLGQPIYLEASRVRVTPVLFLNNIVLENINFRHSQGGPFILKKINLTIKKGSKVGFIGPTGGGKSTLLDILMGLLLPTEGRLLVDGREISKENTQGWQANIAHVPQNIFLADASIAENIAIGQKIKEIDYCYLQEAAIKAQISETINSMPDQYQTFVGERGIRLSGGQRQRIGIARALYKKSNVIILDEATNALDDLTESEVMHEIAKMSEEITVLIVAHRLSTLKNCDQVVELKEGRIRVIDSSQFAESGIF